MIYAINVLACHGAYYMVLFNLEYNVEEVGLS